MPKETAPKSAIPKRRQRHHSFDDSVDEPEKLIEDEPMEIEKEIPVEESEPVERIDDTNAAEPPTFEE